MTTSSPLAPAHLRRALLAALALLVLGIGVTPGHAVAASDADTITTVLYPGWNMVGWVGPSAPTSELFDAIPALRQVSAWDAEAQAYQHAPRRRYSDLPTLTPGMGLWLRLGGNSTVEWTRPVSDDAVMVWLVAGDNLVAAPANGTFAPLRSAATAAWRWNPARQQFESHRFGTDVLSLGDGLWIEMSSPLNWLHSGVIDPPLVLLGDIPADVRTEILAEYERMRKFFLERLRILATGPLHYIGADVDALREAPFGTSCHSSSNAVHVSLLRCTHPNHAHSMVWEYVPHIMRTGLAESWQWRGALPVQTRGADWLTYGTEEYLWFEYLDANGRVSEEERRVRNGVARRTAAPLSDYEEAGRARFIGYDVESVLSILSVELLAQRAGEPTLFDYFHRVRFSSDWREAFRSAFGMSVEDFYKAFATYRAETFPPLPHLTDDLDELVLVVLDDVPVEASAAVSGEFERVRRFFTDRFGAEATEVTLYVAQDAETALAAAPGWHGGRECRQFPSFGLAVIVLERCDSSALHYTYFDGVRSELAFEQPRSPSGSTVGWAPAWFDTGVELYSLAMYAADTRSQPYGTYRDVALSAVEGNPTHLERIETPSDARAVGSHFASSIGFLAVEWLANHAGDPAVFEYYRLLPEATSPDEAFEQAFGLTFEEFHEQFEAYRETLEAP